VGFEERARDVGRIVEWLRARPDVDPERVGLVAVSQGTWVASLVGASDPRLAFVVQIAGPAVSPLEADTFALLHRWRHAGLTAGELTAAGLLWTLEVAAVRSPPGSPAWTRYRDAVARAVRTSWYPKSRYSPSEPTGWFAGWYPLVAGHQPGAAISATMAPSLWIYGAGDSQSDVERNVQVLRSLRASARAPIEMACFPNAGHGLNVPVESASGAMPATVAPGFFGLIDGWLTLQAELPDGANLGFAAFDDGSSSVGCAGVSVVAPR
jgi:dienelactone hydrolase